jgi:hypothetical protein
MHRGVPCIAEYSRVCVEGTPAAEEPTILRFDHMSTCDGKPCVAGPCNRPRFYFNGSRFPIDRLERVIDVGAITSREVALLPSGLTNWHRPWFERAPGASTGPNAEHNMAHLLYDSFLHEVDISARTRIAFVLGEYASNRTRSVTHELRRRLLANASFLPNVTSCFEKLFTYSWSCDRGLERYAPLPRHEHQSPAAIQGTRRASLGSIRSLRRLAPFRRLPPSSPKLLILCGRSDASRRRLLNLTAHLEALRGHFAPPGWDVVSWDDYWRLHTPSVDEQANLIRNAHLVVTPHGAVPSVWAFLLRKGAALYEIFSSCMTHSWLPAHLMAALSIDHRPIHGHTRYAPWKSLNFQLVDPRTGRLVTGCQHYPYDPDVLIKPERLTAVVAKLWMRWQQRQRGWSNVTSATVRIRTDGK